MKLLLIIGIVLALQCCKNSPTDPKEADRQIEKIRLDSGYTNAKFYCWCFRGDGMSPCETAGSVKPSELIKPEHLFDSVAERPKMESIVHLILKQGESLRSNREWPDSRFVILLSKPGYSVDTIVYLQTNEFVYNQKYLISYSFNVLDSIRSILGREKILCK